MFCFGVLLLLLAVGAGSAGSALTPALAAGFYRLR
jgi:hypothetical protein